MQSVSTTDTMLSHKPGACSLSAVLHFDMLRIHSIMPVFAPNPGRLRAPVYCRTEQPLWPAARQPAIAQRGRRQQKARYQPALPCSARRGPLQQCRAQAEERLAKAAPAPPVLEHRAGEDVAVFDPASQSAASWAVFTAVFAVVMVILYEVLRFADYEAVCRREGLSKTARPQMCRCSTGAAKCATLVRHLMRLSALPRRAGVDSSRVRPSRRLLCSHRVSFCQPVGCHGRRLCRLRGGAQRTGGTQTARHGVSLCLKLRKHCCSALALGPRT